MSWCGAEVLKTLTSDNIIDLPIPQFFSETGHLDATELMPDSLT